MMHSRLLYHFSVIADEGTLSAAAKVIGVTQPALTRSVKQLEDIIGASLLDRRPNGVVLTDEGRILARRVKLMSLEYQHALAEISDRTEGVRGRLRIAGGPTWILSILPPAIIEFQKQYPEVAVTLTGPGWETQVKQLLDGDLDAVFGPVDFPAQADIEKEPLLTLRHTIFGRAEHPLAGLEQVPAETLAGYKWVAFAEEDVSIRSIRSYFLANRLEPPKVAVETNPFGALTIVRSSDYLTSFADHASEQMRGLGLAPIRHEGTFWDFEAGLVRRKSSRPSPALEAFRGVLKSLLNE